MICKIRLATSEALLAKGALVYAWGVPAPSLPIYNDHSAKALLSDGGQSLRGYASVSLTWDRLTWYQAYIIRKLAEDAIDAGGVLYATVNRAWNRKGMGSDWIDVSGKPHIPDGTPAGNTDGLLSDGFTLFLNNLTIESDPSAYA